MKVTYYGHSCFGIETTKTKILFDPFISPNPLASHIDVNSIEADYILISHGHEYHIADAEAIAKRTDATVVANFKVVGWLGNKGVENGHPMNTGGKWKFNFGQVQLVAAVHSSSMPDGSYGGSANGFVVKIDGKTLYFAGDTALFLDMKLIGESNTIDFAFLPIGSNFTMDVEDACRAAKFVNTTQVIGMHYDTFPYVKIDHSEAHRAAATNSLDLHLIPVGESIEI